MVGGAHGPVGHHVQQNVAMVREPGNVFAITPNLQKVEMLVLAVALINKLVTIWTVKVRNTNVCNANMYCIYTWLNTTPIIVTTLG